MRLDHFKRQKLPNSCCVLITVVDRSVKRFFFTLYINTHFGWPFSVVSKARRLRITKSDRVQRCYHLFCFALSDARPCEKVNLVGNMALSRRCVRMYLYVSIIIFTFTGHSTSKWDGFAMCMLYTFFIQRKNTIH